VQLELPLDWGREPWAGVRPRALTRGVREKWSCAVDNFDVESESREATAIFTDAAQLTLFLKGKTDGA